VSRDGLLIGEVARQSGARRKALRLYERAGILPPVQRTEAGYRVYGAEALDLLAFVRQAQRLGFTLEEIKETSRSEQGVYRARTFTVWYCGNGRTSIAGLPILPMSASGWTRCSEAGGRGAERRLCASTSSRTAIPVVHPTTFATH